MMIVPACEGCLYEGKKPEMTGEKDEDIITIPLGCLMCLFETKEVIQKLGIRQEEIEEVLF